MAYINTTEADVVEEDELELEEVADTKLQKIFQEMGTQPIEIFAEMQELLAGRWVQTARWVKYEELADIDGGRWSTPHVASFDGKTLCCLQHLISNGICVLECNFQNIETLSALISAHAASEGKLSRYASGKLSETISSKHLHLKETQRGMFAEAIHRGGYVSTHQIGVKYEPSHDAEVEHGHRINLHFQKKLEQGAEGASVMVGAVDYLEKPLFIFMRQSVHLPGSVVEELTEVDVTLRYVCVILGPLQRVKIMHDVGRAMAICLTDCVFQVVARSATSNDDLLHALRNFSDHATLLAPDQWNPSVRLDPPAHVARQDERKWAIDYEAELEVEAETLLIDKPTEEHFAVHLPPGLQVTGRIFGGLVADLQRKLPYLKSDWVDGFSVQVIASVLFLFFITLTQMVSFGALMGEATGNNVATFETILSSCLMGAMYHIFAGQPLNIISTTGPVLILERLLYNFCSSWGLQFLEFRFWVGAWMGLIMLVIVMFDLSFLVCFITRFTEDSFAALIAAIFIYEAIKSVAKLYKQTPVAFNIPGRPRNHTCECRWKNESLYDMLSPDIEGSSSTSLLSSISLPYNKTAAPSWMVFNEASNSTSVMDCRNLNGTNCFDYAHCDGEGPGCGVSLPVPDVFLFSLLLFLGTFAMANLLKAFRLQPFFSNTVRAHISDFAVVITIFTMVLLDYLCGLPTTKLIVPKEFRPTNPNRGWVVPIFKDNPFWTIFMAFPPGLLAAILLFMDHQITTVIVNRKEHLLKKGFGYHLDLFVVTVQIILCSVLGITWLVASTVLAIGHVNSLRKESDKVAPGEHPKFLGIREQRLSGVLISILIGLSILARDALALIPMCVCYGCFLYMGVNVLKECGIFQRSMLFFMPAKYQPPYPFLRHVRLARVHYFTLFQLGSFICLWALKEIDAVSMLFPLMLVVMVFIRKSLDFIFTNEELHYLDDIMPPFHIPRVAKGAKLDADLPEAPPTTTHPHRHQLTQEEEDEEEELQRPLAAIA